MHEMLQRPSKQFFLGSENSQLKCSATVSVYLATWLNILLGNFLDPRENDWRTLYRVSKQKVTLEMEYQAEWDAVASAAIRSVFLFPELHSVY